MCSAFIKISQLALTATAASKEVPAGRLSFVSPSHVAQITVLKSEHRPELPVGTVPRSAGGGGQSVKALTNGGSGGRLSRKKVSPQKS